MGKQTIILVRRGINGFRYSACDSNGNFLGNVSRLAEVRQHWKVEIKRGQVVLVRELDKMPDMTRIETTKQNIEMLIKSYCKNKPKN